MQKREAQRLIPYSSGWKTDYLYYSKWNGVELSKTKENNRDKLLVGWMESVLMVEWIE